MPRKKSGPDRRQEKRKKMALVIVEVARATNDGKVPTSQQELRQIIRSRHGINIAPATLTGYVKDLEAEELGRRWLRTDGWDVYLASPKRTLSDSVAINALHAAQKLSDDDARVSISQWVEYCSKILRSVTADQCRTYLDEYFDCEYLLTLELSSDLLQLNRAAYNQDLFYLKVAGAARLRKIRSMRKHGPT